MIKYFVGGDIGCAPLTFSHKPLRLFPRTPSTSGQAVAAAEAHVAALGTTISCTTCVSTSTFTAATVE